MLPQLIIHLVFYIFGCYIQNLYYLQPEKLTGMGTIARSEDIEIRILGFFYTRLPILSFSIVAVVVMVVTAVMTVMAIVQ